MTAQPEPLGDSELWRRTASGDDGAFAELYTRHVDRVARLLRRRVPADAVEDLCAQVFLEAWRQRDRVRVEEGAGLLPWLLGVALNLSRAQVRTSISGQRLLARLPAPLDEPDHAEELTTAAERAEQIALARLALAALSPEDQEVITLCVLEELTPTQAALALGQRASTVRSRLTRARRRLEAGFSAQVQAHARGGEGP